MCILSDRSIMERIESESLGINPFRPENLNTDSLDLCLLGEYLVFEELWRIDAVDLSVQTGNAFLSGEIGLCARRVLNAPNMILRPGQVIVAYLEERIKMPSDLCGIIDGKSKWARLGLQVASAGLVHASWEGVPVLELVNLGNIPLKLTPGIPICQIRFEMVVFPPKIIKKGD